MNETVDAVLSPQLDKRFEYSIPQPILEKHVRFRLSGEAFCLRAEMVRGVMGAQSLIPALNSGLGVVGFVFCQNKALPVLDLRPKLNLHPSEVSAKGAIILVSLPSEPRFRAGIVVEQIEQAMEFSTDAVLNQIHDQIPLQFLRGKVVLEERTTWVLDLDFLLNPVHLRRLESISY